MTLPVNPSLTGESPTELRHRALRDRERRIRQALLRLRDQRELLRRERVRRELPVVAVVGYTNSGACVMWGVGGHGWGRAWA